MFELLPVFLSTIVLGFLCHMFSRYDHSIENYTIRHSALWIVLFLIMVCFAGTRYNYNDTLVYIAIYDEDILPLSVDNLKKINYVLGENPGFVIFQQILKRIGFTSQSFVFITSIITIGTFLWFIRKYTTDIFMSVYLFVTFDAYTFMLAGIKQSLAMAFSAIAVDRIIKNKKASFVFWILLASTFHPYALMYLICPFLFFKPWTRKTWYLLGLFGLAGLSFQFLLPRVVSVTQMMGEDYTMETFDMGGVNPIRVAVCSVTIFLSYFVKDRIEDSHYNKINNLIVNLAMLNAELMFVGMFGASIFSGRLANYFILFQLLALPFLIKHIDRKFKSIVYVSAIVLFFAFFYYSNAMAYERSFDDLFYRHTLGEYFSEGIFIK